MLRDRLRRLNYQHTVMGAVLGWLLYLVNFSGAVTMFENEIYVWEEPAARVESAVVAPLQPILDRFAAEAEGPIDYVRLVRPTPGSAFFVLGASVRNGEDAEYREIFYAADTGLEVTPRGGDGVSLWIEHLHRYLAIEPKTVGRILVGLTGVYMLALLLSGVVIHQRISRDLFKIRWNRSFHLKWKDLHNATGLWTLPFAVVISFSGVMVGAVVLFAIVAAQSITAGDLAKLEGMLADSEGDTSYQGPAPMYSADAALAKVAAESPFIPFGVMIRRYGDRNAAYFVLADSPDEMIDVAPVPIDPQTGAIEMERYSPMIEGLPESVAARIFTAMWPLHYGLFGGLALKVLYFFLGMALSVCIAVGMLIYFERRLNGNVGHFSQQTYQRLSLLNAGVLAGLPAVTLLVFYLDRLLMEAGADRYGLLGISFFVAWGFCIAYCLWLKQARVGARRLMWLTVSLGILLPVFDFATVGHGLGNTAVLIVHGSSVVCALALLAYLLSSPAHISTSDQRRQAPAAAEAAGVDQSLRTADS